MTRAARSGITLAVLSLILLIGLVWGWKSLTSPLPSAVQAPVCEDIKVSKGDKITRAEVTVSVLNAGGESGLAGQVMEQLVALGFGEGEIANVEAEVVHSQIWTDSPASPLVKANLAEAYVTPTDNDYPGVVVVLGTAFDGVQEGPESIRSKLDGSICSPSA